MRVLAYIFKQFFPVFILGIIFFVFILQLVEVFANMNDFMQNNVPLDIILRAQILQIPRSITFALPIAMVFSASFVMGTLQTRNEILALFATGFSMRQIVMGMFLFSVIIGISGFFLQESVAVPLLQDKKTMMDKALNRALPTSSTSVQVYDKKHGFVYYVNYYNAQNQEIQNLDLVKRDEAGGFVEIYRAERAVWKTDRWILYKVGKMIFLNGREQRFEFLEELNLAEINVTPVTFQGQNIAFESMTWGEALNFIQQRKDAGLKFQKEETRLYERLAFAFTPMVILLLAVSAGRRFRKHVILLSMIVSIGLAVVYYVIQLVTTTLAGLGILPPLVGAWASVAIFLTGGLALLWRDQRT